MRPLTLLSSLLLGLAACTSAPEQTTPESRPGLDGTQVSAAKLDMQAIDAALTNYALMNGGQYPDSLELLVLPDENGHSFLRSPKLPSDPWGGEYQYAPPSEGKKKPRLTSFGKDGQPGGVGEDADITH